MPGWWLGQADNRDGDPSVSPEQWDRELRQAGFSGTDCAVLDDEPPHHVNVSIFSTAINTEPAPAPKQVTFLHRKQKNPFARDLAARFQLQGTRVD